MKDTGEISSFQSEDQENRMKAGQWRSEECKNGLSFGKKMPATSPQHLSGLSHGGQGQFHITLSIRSCPLMFKGPCVFVVGCLDTWMTVSNQHNTHRHHMLHGVCQILWSFMQIHKTILCLHTLWKLSLLSNPQGPALLLKVVSPFTYCSCRVCVHLDISLCHLNFNITLTYLSLLSRVE